ncbi:hypothetical protein [Flavobacterium sp.]|jgi:hypothetical protein|uniref:hypothetical protein n=1 Tax=Flavobacterium sp. TaxID=239 RepID=UPI0022C489D4|nr:hypothetical protein [Flavobacterium sp.]MCZ8143889.1 hypothetical protein [Flavobacterium sp.]MCZ8367536.1 hypothetical protein [Flavobacterium sp.]
MNKKELILGFAIGLLTTGVGLLLVALLFSLVSPNFHWQSFQNGDLLGKYIALGSLLNLLPFFILLSRKKEAMGYGIILAVAVLTLSTLFF